MRKKTNSRFKSLLDLIFFLAVLGIFLFSLINVVDYLKSRGVLAVEPANEGCSLCNLIPVLPTIPLPVVTCTPTPTAAIPTQVPSSPTPTTTIVPTPTPTTSAPNDGGSQSNGGGGGGSTPVCNNPTPEKPVLNTLVILESGKVSLQWDPVVNATHYSIVYGPKSGDYIYGVANVGNLTSFIVGALGTGNYCFAIRAVNDCAPSELSDEKCTSQILGTGRGGTVLGASTLGATGDGFNLFKISSFEVSKIIDFTQFGENQMPVEVKISDLGLTLPIEAGKISNGNWDISETGASYLAGSGILGEKGNAIIYGHNKNNLLGPIRWIKQGSIIEVKNKEGKSFEYEVVETKTVNSDQIEVLKQTDDSQITLYTCTGFMDAQRFVVVAKLR